mmetsp:Transcript_13509/g.32649  ORF Transcript_13509/g.32649 Transcript_13509/m.32649 type:complete len:206 (+) Transcript_13509:295-912(+)
MVPMDRLENRGKLQVGFPKVYEDCVELVPMITDGMQQLHGGLDEKQRRCHVQKRLLQHRFHVWVGRQDHNALAGHAGPEGTLHLALHQGGVGLVVFVRLRGLRVDVFLERVRFVLPIRLSCRFLFRRRTRQGFRLTPQRPRLLHGQPRIGEVEGRGHLRSTQGSQLLLPRPGRHVAYAARRGPQRVGGPAGGRRASQGGEVRGGA